MQSFLNGIDAGRSVQRLDVMKVIDICLYNTQLHARFVIAIDRRSLQGGVIGDLASRVQSELISSGITRDIPFYGLVHMLLGKEEMN